MGYDVGKAFREIEEYLINSMMRNFKHHRAEELKEGYNWTQWQAEQMKALEKYRKNNSKKFRNQFFDINDKVAEMIKIARESGNADQELEILEAIKDGLIIGEKPSVESMGEFLKLNDKKLNALIKATTNDLQAAETAILRKADDEYRKAIYNAQVAANTGSLTYNQAVDMACKNMLTAGLNCVEYKNGARHTLSDYADMAVKTATKRAYLYGEGEKRKEWGFPPTVVVANRMGGCPSCAKFIGKVFIDDVWSGGKKSDGNYPLLSSAIELGLFHPRCKDITRTYYEGISSLDPELSKWEIKDLEKIEQLEQQKAQAKNQAKKCQRIADYSLDKDNKRLYRKRANDWTEKADKIERNIAKTVAKSADNGIIGLNRKIERREKNIGVFSNLKIPMQKRYVLEYCKKYNIDTKGLTFKIQRSESLLKLKYFGMTDYDNIGRIDLLPNAFIDEEQLIRTVLHEKCHVKQLRKYGKKYVQEHLADMERRAYRFEDVYYNILKRRANI